MSLASSLKGGEGLEERHAISHFLTTVFGGCFRRGQFKIYHLIDIQINYCLYEN